MVTRQEISLTWKYFWQQKFIEISLTLLVIAAILFIPYLFGHNIGNNSICGKYYGNATDSWRHLEQGAGIFTDITLDECSSRKGMLKPFGIVGQWIEGVLYIIVVFFWIIMIGIVLLLIYLGFEEWLQSNWEKASKRAKKEIRKSKHDAKRGKDE